MLRGNTSLEQILLLLPALIFAFTIHEISHGLMAYLLGDSTAKRDGRLSLNPIRHIDLLGLIFILFVGFGWAKPVMVNPNNLKNPKVDMALIAVVGPISNFIMAFLSLMLWYPLMLFTNVPAYITEVLMLFCFLNIILGVFNLIPIPPLDGSKVIAGALPDFIYNNLPPIGRFGMLLLLVLILSGVPAQFLLPMAEQIRNMLLSSTVSIYGWIWAAVLN